MYLICHSKWVPIIYSFFSLILFTIYSNFFFLVENISEITAKYNDFYYILTVNCISNAFTSHIIPWWFRTVYRVSLSYSYFFTKRNY